MPPLSSGSGVFAGSCSGSGHLFINPSPLVYIDNDYGFLFLIVAGSLSNFFLDSGKK